MKQWYRLDPNAFHTEVALGVCLICGTIVDAPDRREWSLHNPVPISTSEAVVCLLEGKKMKSWWERVTRAKRI